ncbi:hypothetical protein [Pelagicoccus sp. SDUM812002]|nr:hypothetical protein [Pelagicoccus sp. SDUM812002]MDQ8187946.1 hypothetical protein [Pelagicoccus sp. SDUM812002]
MKQALQELSIYFTLLHYENAANALLATPLLIISPLTDVFCFDHT